jgi:stage IV sporulation protein FB
MFRFRIFGIPVEVQPWFWIILAVLGGGVDNETWSEGGFGLLKVVLFVMAGFISIMTHELGHALTGKAFGAPTQITLHAFGGFAAFPAGSFTRKQSFVVTFAGPAGQIVLGLAALALVLFFEMPTKAISHFVWALALVSLLWAVLNLLPVVPLDGGNLVMAALGPTRIRLALWISFVTAIAAGVGLAWSSPGFFMFSLFLASFAFENWKVLQHLKGR